MIVAGAAGAVVDLEATCEAKDGCVFLPDSFLQAHACGTCLDLLDQADCSMRAGCRWVVLPSPAVSFCALGPEA